MMKLINFLSNTKGPFYFIIDNIRDFIPFEKSSVE